MPNAKLAAALAIACAVLLGALLLLSVSSGVTQQEFEILADLEHYRARLLQNDGSLRAILAVDNVFAACYVAMTIVGVPVLVRPGNRRLLAATIFAVCVAGVLDWAENHHIATMLAAARHGLEISVAQVELQMTLSMLKWHLAYFAFAALGLAIEPRAAWERGLRFALVAVQMPIGVAVYAAVDSGLYDVLLWARYLNLWTGFLLLALVFVNRRSPSCAGSDSAPPQ